MFYSPLNAPLSSISIYNIHCENATEEERKEKGRKEERKKGRTEERKKGRKEERKKGRKKERKKLYA